MKKLHAWIQMGTERRETTIEIPDAHIEGKTGGALEEQLTELVLDWIYAQYGWGWSGGGFEYDFGFMEGLEHGGRGALQVTSESSIPNTRLIKLCPDCRQPIRVTERTQGGAPDRCDVHSSTRKDDEDSHVHGRTPWNP